MSMKRKMHKRFLGVFLILMMLVSMMPETGLAAEDLVSTGAEREGIGEERREEIWEEIREELGGSKLGGSDREKEVSPAYEAEVPAEYVSDLEELARIIREAMLNFETDVQVYVRSPRYEEEPSLTAIDDLVYAHTGDPKGGDILWDEYFYSISRGERIYDDNYLYRRYTIRTSSEYTKDQAAELDAAIGQLVESWDLEGLSDYEKVRLVYDWICANITYDHYHLENEPEYSLMYTTYAAMIHRTCVCNGYANLFYRLAL